MSRACWGGLLLAAVILAACAPPPRGALYEKLIAPSTSTATPPAGASLAQYYTLGAFRVADHLASASNALDDGLADRAQGLISADYLLVIAARSAQTAQDAMTEADQLAAPPGIRSQADHFYAAAAALATAVTATKQALAGPTGANSSALATATQQRRAAAQTLETDMSALEGASWSTRSGS
jgi:hypothetical protein